MQNNNQVKTLFNFQKQRRMKKLYEKNRRWTFVNGMNEPPCQYNTSTTAAAAAAEPNVTERKIGANGFASHWVFQPPKNLLLPASASVHSSGMLTPVERNDASKQNSRVDSRLVLANENENDSDFGAPKLELDGNNTVVEPNELYTSMYITLMGIEEFKRIEKQFQMSKLKRLRRRGRITENRFELKNKE